MKQCLKTFEEIVGEWHAEFSFLTQYSPSAFFERVGPFVMGLRLYKMGKSYYQVGFEIWPLWVSAPKASWAYFSDWLLIENRFGSEVDIEKHDLVFEESVKSAKEQYGKVIGPAIRLEDMVSFLEASYERLIVKMPSDRTSILELELGLGVFLNNEMLINETWCKIKKESKKWKGHYFESLHGYGVKDWIVRMRQLTEDRDGLIQKVERISKSPRLAKLNVGEFTGVDDYQPPRPTLLDRLLRLFPV